MKKAHVQLNYRKLIGLVSLLILIGLFVYFIYLYNFIEKDKRAGYEETISLLLNETDIVEVENVSSFQAEEYYHIAIGKDNDNIDLIAFVPVDNPKDVVTIPIEETITEKNIINKWDTECVQCKFISLELAMIEGYPLWELTYVDDSNRYVFDYYSLYDGKQYEQLRLKRRYQ